MKKPLLIVQLLLFHIAVVSAQPSNDDCTNPLLISDVTSFCSPTGAFSNAGATPSTYQPANCFGTTTQNDVWFTFTPIATDVTITVRGATSGGGAGGTLRSPQVALYFGACGATINELGCDAASGSTNVAELYEGGLFVGTSYLIRVQGGGGQTGTFQLCINNYNPPVEPTSDCPRASILCDKSPFVVKSVTGAGNDNREMEDATCFDNGSPGLKESNSTWFVWTCSKSGPLEFALTSSMLPTIWILCYIACPMAYAIATANKLYGVWLPDCPVVRIFQAPAWGLPACAVAIRTLAKTQAAPTMAMMRGCLPSIWYKERLRAGGQQFFLYRQWLFGRFWRVGRVFRPDCRFHHPSFRIVPRRSGGGQRCFHFCPRQHHFVALEFRCQCQPANRYRQRAAYRTVQSAGYHSDRVDLRN